MKKLLLLTFTITVFIFSKQAFAEEMVTVKLKNYLGMTNRLNFEMVGDYFTLDPTLLLEEGVTYQLEVKQGNLWLQGNDTMQNVKGSFVLVPVTYDKNHMIIVNDRPYLGSIEFTIESGKYVRPINQLLLEDYLKGVVPFEVHPSWGMEALKAQSLAARTYAVTHLGDNMDDTISYQVYGGYSWNTRTTEAVEKTKGEVITYQNKLIEAFYSASNGGMTESNENVWGGTKLPYFPVKKDKYDPINPWEVRFHQTQLNLEEINWDEEGSWELAQEKDKEITDSIKSWLHNNGYPGEIKILSIPHFELSDEKFKSKRSIKGSITIEFLHRLIDGTVIYEQEKVDNDKLNRIRPMIGGTRFKSYLLDSLEEKDGVYVLKGRGYGHGVGMSQWGAHIMSTYGKTYKEIINFYFPKTTISLYD